MALIKCPECNESVFEKANSCPHCGYPLKPEVTPIQYELEKDQNTVSSAGAKFLWALAWLFWIGGLILAIVSSIGSGDYGRYSSSFNWQNFFTILITYAIYGGLACCVSFLLEEVHTIFQMVYTLKLVEKKKTKSDAKTQPNAHLLSTHRFSGSADRWKCSECGSMNDKDRRFCKDCGASKY